MQWLKYILAVAVGAFVAGFGAKEYMDSQITKATAPLVSRIEKLETDVSSLQKRELLAYNDKIALRTQSGNEQHFIGTASGKGPVTTYRPDGQPRSAASADETFLVVRPSTQ